MEALTAAPTMFMSLKHPEQVLAVTCIATPPRFVTGCQDGVVRVYHSNTLAVVKKLEGQHARGVQAMTVSSGHLFTASLDSVAVWEVDAGFALVKTFRSLRSHGSNLSLRVLGDWLLVGSQSCRILHTRWRSSTSTGRGGKASGRGSAGQRRRRGRKRGRPSDNATTAVESDARASAGGTTATAPPTAAVGTATHVTACGTTTTIPVAGTTVAAGVEAVGATAWSAADGHEGYVYALQVAQRGGGRVVFSGSGDNTIGVWEPTLDDDGVGGLKRLRALKGHTGSVFDIRVLGSELWSCSQDRTVRVWDIESLGCKRVLEGHEDEVLCLAPAGHDGGRRASLVCSGSADRTLRLWDSRRYVLLHVLRHPDVVLAVAAGSALVHVSCADHVVHVWDVSDMVAPAGDEGSAPETAVSAPDAARNRRSRADSAAAPAPELSGANTGNAHLLTALRHFVSIPTVSSQPKYKRACWEGAKFLHALFERYGADVRLVQADDGSNPVVLARMGWTPDVPTVVVYGHYDVQPADEPGWATDPFTLTGKDGYFYGRGTSDHKGPFLAAVFAAAKARASDRNDLNVVFIAEGEGEHGSIGFEAAVATNMDWFRGATLILNNNNTWMGEDRPCLTYGLRGCVQLTATVKCGSRDLHSGVDGGVILEPLVDLSALIASLVDPATGRVTVDGFYDNVAKLGEAERALLADVDFDVRSYRETLGVRRVKPRTRDGVLSRRWREPSLTVHSVTSSSARTSVVPHAATATITVRTAPHQEAQRVEQLLLKHLETEFRKRKSPNQLAASAQSTAEWWMSDPHSAHYKAAARAVEKHWGARPMFVREGGSLRVTCMMSQLLQGTPTLLLPAGQSSDACHLQNERIRAVNLFTAVSVIQSLFEDLAAAGVVAAAAPSVGAEASARWVGETGRRGDGSGGGSGSGSGSGSSSGAGYGPGLRLGVAAGAGAGAGGGAMAAGVGGMDGTGGHGGGLAVSAAGSPPTSRVRGRGGRRRSRIGAPIIRTTSLKSLDHWPLSRSPDGHGSGVRGGSGHGGGHTGLDQGGATTRAGVASHEGMPMAVAAQMSPHPGRMSTTPSSRQPHQ